MEKTDARKLTRDAQETLRQRVILAIVEDKVKQKDAVKFFRVSQAAISKWMRIYKKSGVNGLTKKRQGRPKQTGKLKGWQSSWIVRTITDKCPDQLKFPWGLWTRECVRALIQQKFEIELSVSSTSRLLKKWGFTPQKPIRRAYERNPKAVAHWIKRAYPIIHAKAKQEKAAVYWGDEMGVKNTDQTGRSFSRKGCTPIVANTTKRLKCNMISAINNLGNARFMLFEEDFTVDVFLKFLTKLIYKQDQKIFLILDNHRVHHAKKTKSWLEKHAHQIELFFLPPYSPELNPDELLNQTVKQRLKHKPAARSQAQLKQAVHRCVKSVQKSSSTIRSFFQKSELSYIFSASV